MPERHAISDEDWARIELLLPGRPGGHGGVANDNRLFIDAVLWIAKTGAPWRDLPDRLGKWNSVWKRFDRWSRQGVWQRIFEAVHDPDLRALILDSTNVRAHPHAAGAKKEPDGSGGQSGEAFGMSRGGWGTKAHVAATGEGLPVRITLTPGNAHDASQVAELIEGLRPDAVIADKAYDSRAVADLIQAQGAEVVIPSLSNRAQQRAYDQQKYKERNVVERFWRQAKGFRRVATRYEKRARNFLAMILVASIIIIL